MASMPALQTTWILSTKLEGKLELQLFLLTVRSEWENFSNLQKTGKQNGLSP